MKRLRKEEILAHTLPIFSGALFLARLFQGRLRADCNVEETTRHVVTRMDWKHKRKDA
jgi:hypothetical protein